jgi:hypothetical protein
MLGKFIAGDFIAIAGEMRRFPASNENKVCGLLQVLRFPPPIKLLHNIVEILFKVALNTTSP